MSLVLSIAGFDSSGGAGVHADQRAFEALDVDSSYVLSAITHQTDKAVHSVFCPPLDMFSAQLESHATSVRGGGLTAVKVGLCCNTQQLGVLASLFRGWRSESAIPIVLDPVLESSSGYAFHSGASLGVLREELLPLCSVLTPNHQEASILLGCTREWVGDNPEEASQQLYKLGGGSEVLRGVVLTGGDVGGKICEDFVFQGGPRSVENGTVTSLQSERVGGGYFRGTGCMFSSALAVFLGRGDALLEAVHQAKDFVYSRLQNGRLRQVNEQ